jgi:glycosyltransferase involved in cell wall biosynthesis
VASDIPGYRAAAGGNAELVSPGDPVALASALERALAGVATGTGRSSPAAIAAARAYAEQWSMDRRVGRYEDLYDRARGRFAGRQ